LTELSLVAWRLFGLQGFARVDFRVGEDGEPMILELNPNPCLEPGSGLAAAAAQAGLSYADLVETILSAAIRAHSVA
jgi:D-alanine-D-alanine ligase